MNKAMQEFLSFEKLYHFTKFESALKIINGGQIKYGRLSKMNDASEKEKHIYNSFKNGEEDFNFEVIEKEINNYEQVSLTEDRNKFSGYGFELHQMWGIYADKGKGVCFVFDRHKLIDYVKQTDCEVIMGPVAYSTDFSQDIFTDINSNAEIKSWIKENAHKLFFTKRKEWEYEQEFRLVKRFDEHDDFHGIPIMDCLKYVIIFTPETSSHHDFVENCLEYKLLKYFLPNTVPILSYECFCQEYQLIGYVRETVWCESCQSSLDNGEQIDILAPKKRVSSQQ